MGIRLVITTLSYSFSILRLSDAGVLDTWIKKYWPKQQGCGPKTSSSVGLHSMSGLYYVTAGLLSLATIVLCIEIFTYKRKSRKYDVNSK